MRRSIHLPVTLRFGTSACRAFAAAAAKSDKNKPVPVLVRRGEWVNYLVIRPGR